MEAQAHTCVNDLKKWAAPPSQGSGLKKWAAPPTPTGARWAPSLGIWSPSQKCSEFEILKKNLHKNYWGPHPKKLTMVEKFLPMQKIWNFRDAYLWVAIM